MKIEDRNNLNILLDRYGSLLTSSQLEIMTDYCAYDLSLSEIAESRSISRAAVEDAIKKATKKLVNYEENIKLEDLKKRLSKALKDKDLGKLEEEINGI